MALPRPIKAIEQRRLLLVEGDDERRLCETILQRLRSAEVQVIDIAGKQRFRIELPTLRGVSGFSSVRCIGVVRDADADAGAAFQSVVSILRNNGIPSPAKPGHIENHDGFLVGIFIAPDNSGPGMLEDLCLRIWQGTPALACVDQLLECLRNAKHPPPRFLTEARLRALLATTLDCEARLGLAAERGVIDVFSPPIGPLVAFVRDIAQRDCAD